MKTAEELFHLCNSKTHKVCIDALNSALLESARHGMTLAAEIAGMAFRINDEGSYSTAVHSKEKIISARDRLTAEQLKPKV